MRVLLTAACAALALASAPAAAQGPTTFDTWTRVCADTRAQPAAALAAAEANGFNPVPQAMIPQLPSVMRNAEVRMKTDASAMSIVMVGDGVIPAGGQQLTMDFCAIGLQPADFAALSRQAADWAGVRPEASMTEAGRVSYVFAEDARGRRAIGRGDREAGRAAVQNGTLRFVFLERRGPMTLLMYAAPRLPARRAAASAPSVSSAAR